MRPVIDDSRAEGGWEPRVLPRQDPFWERLSLAPDPPKEAWILGKPPDPSLKIVAIVGSRRPSAYGLSATAHLVRGLAGMPIAIASGLAFGIDAAAHQAAIDAGLPTVALPGSGLAERVIYPRSHLPLARRIVEAGGCLVSELAPEEGAAPWVFPKRNRLIAGISDAVVVVEAARRSGSVITADLALRENKEVLAVPGPIFSELSGGTNHLLSQGAAAATCANDILRAIGLERAEAPTTPPPDLVPDARNLLTALTTPLSFDDLADLLRWPPDRTLAAISILELHGLVEERLGLVRKV